MHGYPLLLERVTVLRRRASRVQSGPFLMQTLSSPPSTQLSLMVKGQSKDSQWAMKDSEGQQKDSERTVLYLMVMLSAESSPASHCPPEVPTV